MRGQTSRPMAELARRWAALSARERVGLQLAAAALGALLLWLSMIAPAWHTLRDAPQQQQRLQDQLQQMLALRAQAQALQQAVQPRAPQWRRELEQSLSALGTSQITWAGPKATIELQNCPPEALGRWLAELGPRWQLTVSQASLQSPQPGLWQGQLTLQAP